MTPPSPVIALPLLAARSLAHREVVRFLRQPNRVIGALGQPLLFWLLFGAGLDRSFRMSAAGESGQSFMEYYFSGTLMLVLLFTAIFSTISLIEDRREGFLQSVLVAPLPRWSMVLGKVSGGAIIALIQGLLFLLLAFTIGMHLKVLTLAAITTLLGCVAVALASVGFVIAWRMDSTQGFHAVMNLLLMPMWLLSGAFFPIPTPKDAGSIVLHWLMRFNPMTYPMAALRRHLYESSADGSAAIQQMASDGTFWLPSLTTSWIITLLFMVIAFAAACRIARENTSKDLL